jgi:hypothetical protein
MASMLGVGYADIFSGTLCVCGVNYFRDIPATAETDFPATYLPDPRVLPLAKSNGRFVLLTGENDMNRDSTRNTWQQGFQRDGFRNVLYLEVRGMKHALPGAAVLSTALDFLAAGEKPVRPKSK